MTPHDLCMFALEKHVHVIVRRVPLLGVLEHFCTWAGILNSLRAVACVDLTANAHVCVSAHVQTWRGQSSRLVPTVGSLTLGVCD